MKCGLLFSGGKDSCYAGYLAKKEGYELSCLISIYSKNEESYMFHTPSITKTRKQAKVMEIPLLVQRTLGKKEEELKDLEKAILNAKKKYKIKGIITGAIKSTYQASRIQKICNKLNLECFNPLWQKDEFEYLQELKKNKFHTIIVGIFAYPLTKDWLGRKLDESFIKDMRKLNKKFLIHPAGEGGEIETFILNCPLFKKALKIKDKKIIGKENSMVMEINLK